MATPLLDIQTACDTIDIDGPGYGAVQQAIELALQCAQQSQYAAAAAHCAQARTHVMNDRAPLAMALDAFIAGHTRYQHAEQLLHEASRHFAAAAAEQQARLMDVQQAVHAAREVPAASDCAPRAGQPGSLAAPEQVPAVAPYSAPEPINTLPALDITCFGRFEVRREGQPVTLCHNRNGQAILRYLVAHPHHRETVDALVDTLWPDDPPETSRHKLHVAASALRGALNGTYAAQKGAGYLLWANGSYALNPAAAIQIDAELFLALFQAGQRAGGDAAVAPYERACRLYKSPFLPEDLYVDWSLMRREQLTQAYLTMCRALSTHHVTAGRYDEAVQWARAILLEDHCDEAAYRQLIWAHARAGRRVEALREYQRCEQILRDELGLQPLPATQRLAYALQHDQPLPSPMEQPTEE